MAISNMQQARQLRAGGGIMDLEPRQGFFLGKIAKKITRPLKKIAKSPLGKAAMLGAGAYFAGGGGLPKFLGGKGLAGFIKSLDVGSQDQLWETSVKGSKAPISVKINLTFEPIHDIAPGLDADGAMRAPVYNTGRIINSMYGDVYNKDEVVDRDQQE